MNISFWWIIIAVKKRFLKVIKKFFDFRLNISRLMVIYSQPGKNESENISTQTYEPEHEILLFMAFLVGWFCCFTSQVNSYGHCGTVSSPNHTFSWAGLNKRLTSNLCTYFRL